jgi:hypothetical protein
LPPIAVMLQIMSYGFYGWPVQGDHAVLFSLGLLEV